MKALAFAAVIVSATSAHAQIYTVYNTNVYEYPSSGGATSATPFIGLTGSGASLALDGSTLFVSETNGTIQEYNATSGQSLNPNFASGLTTVQQMTVSGSNLYVVDEGPFGGSLGNDNGTVTAYNTSTGTSSTLLTGLYEPRGIAVAGQNMYVTGADGSISEYSTTGVKNTSFSLSGLSDPSNIVISNGDLLVANTEGGVFNPTAGSIGEYDAATGQLIKTLIPGLDNPLGLALTPDGNILVASYSTSGSVAEYDMNGNLITANYLSGANSGYIGDIVDAPEPTTWDMVFMGAGVLFVLARLHRKLS